MLLTEGEISDHKGAKLVVDALPLAGNLLADKGVIHKYVSLPCRFTTIMNVLW